MWIRKYQFGQFGGRKVTLWKRKVKTSKDWQYKCSVIFWKTIQHGCYWNMKQPSARDVLISDWSKALDPRIWLAVDYFDGHSVLIRMQGARSSTESIQREKLLFWAFFWYSNYPASVSWECLGKPGKIQLNDVSLRLNRDCRICRFSPCCLSLCLRLLFHGTQIWADR